MEVIRKIGSAISTLLVTAMVFLAVALVGVRLVGLTPYAVLSGSMEPTYHVGALIYVKEIAPEEIVVGTPITFVVNEDLLLATHRVMHVEMRTTKQEPVLGEDGQPMLDESGNPLLQEVPLDEPVYYYETKGDANEAMDGAKVHHKNVVGTPVFSIPYLGYFSNWVKTPRGMIMGGSVALVLLILTFIPDLLDMVSDDPKEKQKPGKKKPRKKKAEKKPQRKRREESPDEDRPARRKAAVPAREAPAKPVSAQSAPARPRPPQTPPPIARPAQDMPAQRPAIPTASPVEPPAQEADAAPRRRRRRQALLQETEEE